MNSAALSSLFLALLVSANQAKEQPAQAEQKFAPAQKHRGWGHHHHHHRHHESCDPTTESCTSSSTSSCTSSFVPPCHAPVCPYTQGQLTIVKADTTQANAAQVCRDHGFYPADITAFNWVDATDLAFKCSGAFSATWIHSYWENTFDGECLALYTGASAPGGAIAPADCGDRLNVLCSLVKPESWVGNQVDNNDTSSSSHSHHGHHHHHHHGHHHHDHVKPDNWESSVQYEYDSTSSCGRPDFVDPEFESTSYPGGCERVQPQEDFVLPVWRPQPIYGCHSSSSGPAVSWHGPIRAGSSTSDRMETSGDVPCREQMWKQDLQAPEIETPKKEFKGVHEMTPGNKKK